MFFCLSLSIDQARAGVTGNSVGREEGTGKGEGWGSRGTRRRREDTREMVLEMGGLATTGPAGTSLVRKGQRN